MAADSRTHIAVIPFPGAVGHLIPLAHLARHLLHHNPSLFFTFIINSPSPSSAAAPAALGALPATAFHVNHSPLPLHQTLRNMTRQRHVAALIVDMFATEAIDVGSELGIKSYLFFSSSRVALTTFLQLPTYHSSLSDDEWTLDRPLRIPGCPAFRVWDLPQPVHDRSSPQYKWLVDHCRRFKSAYAVVLNSFLALEEEEGPILGSTMDPKLPVYAVGPLVGSVSKSDDDIDPCGCLRWLDDQPRASVLYVCFGSGGTMSTGQVAELACGLELSGQRFLWAVRSPNDLVALDGKMDPLGFLPSGFLERTKGRGFVVPSWAPQVEILGHVSTGGFMTHCGWNSILEGAVNGLGFIAWPLYSEQFMNAIELEEKLKIAIRVKKQEDGVVGRDEIAKVVKELMNGEEGRKIKERMRIIKDEAARTMSQDGFSYVALSKLTRLYSI